MSEWTFVEQGCGMVGSMKAFSVQYCATSWHSVLLWVIRFGWRVRGGEREGLEEQFAGVRVGWGGGRRKRFYK